MVIFTFQENTFYKNENLAVSVYARLTSFGLISRPVNIALFETLSTHIWIEEYPLPV